MSEDRGQLYLRAKSVALVALELPIDERESYVASACAGDETLLSEVRWTLGAAEETGHPYPALPTAMPEDGANLTAALPSGYRIDHLLGEGGMGMVYLAERTVDAGSSAEWRQRVALKLLRFAGFEGSEAHRRFAEERRILATLNHPYIAHLLDAGRTAGNTPYLAMEYVEGERIDHWCQRHDLSLRERIEVFLKVCDAVQYAHGKLVIHRDIKPANILVTAQGEPKLLDFGISRLLDATGEMTEARTGTIHRALTLAYASPEQVSGQPLDVRTDVWSLGVVLYQLACGRRPFDVDTVQSPIDLSKAIVEGGLTAPSRHTPGVVPADVDAIVMKALRVDPAHRYASVTSMAQDLRRYLAARPVLARQGRRWYRVRLFARRHRIAMGVASLLTVLVAAFVMTLLMQLQRVQRERDKTQAVAGFMSDLFEHADPGHAQGENLRVRDMLDRGARQASDDPRLTPEVRAALLLSIAQSYNALDQGARAIPLLKQVLELQATSGLGAIERARAWNALGRAYGIQTDPAGAVAADRKALALYAEASGVPREEWFSLRTHLLLQQLNAGEASAPVLAAQLGLLVAELDREQPALPIAQVQALTTWELALSQAGQNELAVSIGKRASALSDSVYGNDDPERLHADFILALATSASAPEQAVEIYEHLIAERTRMLGVSGAGMSTLQGYLAQTLAGMGEHARAADMLQQTYASSVAESTPRTDFQQGVLVFLANEYLELGRYHDAQSLLEPKLESFIAQANEKSPWSVANLVEALNTLGTVALHDGRLADAEAIYARMPALPSPEVTPDAWTALLEGNGALQMAQRQYALASETLRRFDEVNVKLKVDAHSTAALRARLLEARLRSAQGDRIGAQRVAAAAYATASGRRVRCDLLSRELLVAWQQAAPAGDRVLPSPACPPPATDIAQREPSP